MKTRRWFAFGAMALAGLGLLMISALLSRTSMAVAAGPPAPCTPTATYIPNVMPNSALAAPDLVIEGITYSPPHPDVGEDVDITVTVRNQGDAAAHGFYTYLYADPSDQPPTQTTQDTSYYGHFLTFPSGDSFLWTHTNQTFTASGPRPVYAWVDRDDDEVESDETNNLFGPVYIPVDVACEPDEYEEPSNKIVTESPLSKDIDD